MGEDWKGGEKKGGEQRKMCSSIKSTKNVKSKNKTISGSMENMVTRSSSCTVLYMQSEFWLVCYYSVSSFTLLFRPISFHFSKLCLPLYLGIFHHGIKKETKQSSTFSLLCFIAGPLFGNYHSDDVKHLGILFPDLPCHPCAANSMVSRLIGQTWSADS